MEHLSSVCLGISSTRKEPTAMIKFIIKLFCITDNGIAQKRTYWIEADDENMALINLGANMDQGTKVTSVHSIEVWLGGLLLYVVDVE